MAIVITLDRSTSDKVAKIVVTAPKNAKKLMSKKAMAANGGTAELLYTVGAEATPEFDEWAKMNSIPYSIDMLETGIQVNLDSEEHLLWFKLRWT